MFFTKKKDIDLRCEKADKYLGLCGRLLSGSKSRYLEQYDDHIVVFNANVFVKDGKLWFGDLDISKDGEKLQNLANDIGESVYVLREMDGRFDNEKNPPLKKAVVVFNPSK